MFLETSYVFIGVRIWLASLIEDVKIPFDNGFRGFSAWGRAVTGCGWGDRVCGSVRGILVRLGILSKAVSSEITWASARKDSP